MFSGWNPNLQQTNVQMGDGFAQIELVDGTQPSHFQTLELDTV